MARYIVADADTNAAMNRSATDSFLRGAYQGATFEWGDEAIAAAHSLFGGDYSKTLEEARAKTKDLADANPRTYMAGKFGGALAVPLGGTAAMARGGMTLGQVARTGATIGAASGAAEAAGEYESKGNGLADDLVRGGTKAAIGGIVGGAVGGVASPLLYSLGGGLRAGGRYLYDTARGDEIAPALRKTEQALRRQDTDPAAMLGQLTADATPAVRAMEPEVLADILRNLDAGRTATEVAAIVQRNHGITLSPSRQIGTRSAGFGRANPVPRDMLRLSEEVGGGEAGRSGLTSMMQGISTMPGRGREIALRNMGATMEQAPERMSGRLAGQLGDTDFRRALADREAARRTAAQQNYGAAYAQEQPFDIQPILDGYALYAGRMGGNTGARIQQAVMTLSGVRPGSTNLGTNTLERFQQARRSLEEMVTALRRSADPDPMALNAIRQLRDDVNNAVGQTNPAFRAADQQFASDMAREEAMDLGRAYALRSGQHQDDTLDTLRRLERRHPQHAEELRDYFGQGVLRRLADDVENTGGIPSNMVQPLTGGIRPAPQLAMREALGAPLPNAPIAARNNAAAGQVAGRPIPYQPGQETAQGVTGVLNDEARLKKIFTDVFGNSNTANKLAAQEDMRELPRIAAEMTTGGIAGLRNAVVNRLVRAMTERNAEQIARIVTETDPRVLYVALQDIRRMQPAIHRGEALMAAPAVAAGSSAGQLITGK